MYKFVARPKSANRFDEREFKGTCAKTAAMAAVDFLNEYNELGKKFANECGEYVPALKAEDWAMVGKLDAPAGVYFRDNKVMGVK